MKNNEFKRGDTFKNEAEAIVNVINCVGVMGHGITLQFRNKYSENFTAYQQACKKELVQAEKMFVFENSQLKSPK